MDNLGAVGGPLLALALVAAVGVRGAIWLSVIPGLLAALAIIYAIRHIEKPKERSRVALRFKVRPVLAEGRRWLFIGVGAFELGNVAATLLILRASEQLAGPMGSTRATQIALLLYAAYNLVATIVSLGAGHMADGLGPTGPRVVFATGIAAFIASYVLFAASMTSAWLLLIPFVLAGVGIGCAETAQHAAVASAVLNELRGSSFGLLAALQSLGNLGASAIAGILWTALSPTAAFVYLTAWMVIAFVVILLKNTTTVVQPPDQSR
jgi:MFS family permease